MTLAALADPTRRAVFERLRDGPASVGVIAAALPVSRPAVSQHLKALKDAGLVVDRAEGARRVYCIDPDGLGELRRWLDQFWEPRSMHSSRKWKNLPQLEGGIRVEQDHPNRPRAQERRRTGDTAKSFRGIHRGYRPLVAEDPRHRGGTDPGIDHRTLCRRPLP